MIVFPPGRMWMLNKDGSKWKHVASAVENCKVRHQFSLTCIFFKSIIKIFRAPSLCKTFIPPSSSLCSQCKLYMLPTVNQISFLTPVYIVKGVILFEANSQK